MALTHVVMFLSHDAEARELYLMDLRRLNLLSVWVESVSDARRLLAQFHVAAVVLHTSSQEDWRLLPDLIAAARPSPLIVLASSGPRLVEVAFEVGCAAVITELCTASALASIVRRSISGERGILRPEPFAADAG